MTFNLPMPLNPFVIFALTLIAAHFVVATNSRFEEMRRRLEPLLLPMITFNVIALSLYAAYRLTSPTAPTPDAAGASLGWWAITLAASSAIALFFTIAALAAWNRLPAALAISGVTIGLIGTYYGQSSDEIQARIFFLCVIGVTAGCVVFVGSTAYIFRDDVRKRHPAHRSDPAEIDAS